MVKFACCDLRLNPWEHLCPSRIIVSEPRITTFCALTLETKDRTNIKMATALYFTTILYLRFEWEQYLNLGLKECESADDERNCRLRCDNTACLILRLNLNGLPLTATSPTYL